MTTKDEAPQAEARPDLRRRLERLADEMERHVGFGPFSDGLDMTNYWRRRILSVLAAAPQEP